MVHEVVQRVEDLSDGLRKLAAETESLGRLSDESVTIVREAGVMRLLQPAEYGGYVAHPRDFAEAVMATARACGATGWVTGVCGVHPWEMALMDRRLQDEVWGADSETWIASPYSPSGMATPVDGGYRLNGRWQFSSGTDHCDWIFLGAVVGDAQGRPAQPVQMLHVVLPRPDYTIVPDSWDVMGLRGTGSKDIIVDNAFIPDYRTIAFADVYDASVAAERVGRTETLYRLPFTSLFPLGITSAVIGICEGALEANLAHQRGRTSVTGTQIKDDPTVLFAISEAAAEVNASRVQLIDGISRVYDKVDAGQSISLEERAQVRRNQVRCAWRAVSALDEVFGRAGGNSSRSDNVMQRYWRDAHLGLQHMIHAPGETYRAAALIQMGFQTPPGLGSI